VSVSSSRTRSIVAIICSRAYGRRAKIGCADSELEEQGPFEERQEDQGDYTGDQARNPGTDSKLHRATASRNNLYRSLAEKESMKSITPND
jgi:hypothetical protein